MNNDFRHQSGPYIPGTAIIRWLAIPRAEFVLIFSESFVYIMLLTDAKNDKQPYSISALIKPHCTPTKSKTKYYVCN